MNRNGTACVAGEVLDLTNMVVLLNDGYVEEAIRVMSIIGRAFRIPVHGYPLVSRVGGDFMVVG